MKKTVFTFSSLFISLLLLHAGYGAAEPSAPGKGMPGGGFVFSGDMTALNRKDNCVQFALTNAFLNVYVVEPGIIRFRYSRDGHFSSAPSYAVIYSPASNAAFTLSEQPDRVEIKTDELLVRLSRRPCRISIHDKEGRLLNADDEKFGVSWDGPEVRCFKKLQKDEQFLGLGEKTGPLLRRGQFYTMWNSDYPAYTKKQDPLYASIPFYIGLRDVGAYGIFLDNTYRSYFSMGAGNDRFSWFGADKGEMDYYFIYGPSIRKVISSYTLLTGRMELPPLWALGYQQSRWSYSPESRVREIAGTFRKLEIPCDVIYLDIDYMDGYRVFTWNRERFPDPAKMISDLKGSGFKIVTIIDPGVKADDSYFAAKEGLERDLFAKYPDGTFYKGEVWPSWAYFPDFTSETTRQWWGEKLSAFLKLGVEGFWNDMNEPAVWGANVPDIVKFSDNGFGADHKKIHNVFALEMDHAAFDAVHQYSDKRHLIITRAGFAGLQRYTAIWTGDNVSNNDHLELACLMPQSMGLSGLPYVGTDVGGYSGFPTPELYIRWMQIGAFTPYFRGHSETGMPDKEPWALGEEALKYSREAIRLRYQFLPYLYTEFFHATKTGLPIMRAMAMEYQDDPQCLKAQHQFMAGTNLLVAPVLSDTEKTKKLYLPEGRWLGWWDNRVYQGKQWITVDAPISQIPLFMKEGGVIPLWEVQQYVGEKQIKEVELRIFPGPSSRYIFYEDDGASYEYKKGTFSLTRIEVTKGSRETSINFSSPHAKYESPISRCILKLFDMNEPGAVEAGGTKLKRFKTPTEIPGNGEGFCYDSSRRLLTAAIAYDFGKVRGKGLRVTVK